MSADMLIARLVTRASTTPDIEAGRTALQSLTDTTGFVFEAPDEELNALLLDFDPDFHLDDDGGPTLAAAQAAGQRILDAFDTALRSTMVETLTIGGYRLHLAGGPSWGDSPTEEAEALWNVEHLPASVREAMGLIELFAEPPAPAEGEVTDADVVDAIALGLGTRSPWRGGAELGWIAQTLAKVRSEPGAALPEQFLEDFTRTRGTDPREDPFLADYIAED